jgi:hypothetical protein
MLMGVSVLMAYNYNMVQLFKAGKLAVKICNR